MYSTDSYSRPLTPPTTYQHTATLRLEPPAPRQVAIGGASFAALGAVGIDIRPLLALGSVGSLVVGFAAQATLTNVLCALSLVRRGSCCVAVSWQCPLFQKLFYSQLGPSCRLVLGLPGPAGVHGC